MSEGLGELIEQRRGEIVSRFIALLRQRLGSREELPASALRDHIPDLLSSLAEDLRGGDLDARENRTVLADAHGALRWEQGFDLREVVADYAILHEAILLEAEYAEQPLNLQESRRLVQQINGATFAAVSSYVALRSAQERAHHEQLEALHRARHELISVLSHELNTPLHIIQLSAQLLRTRDATLTPMLEVVERNTTHLSTLVEELLDTADLATGRIRLSWSRVDLCDVAREAIAALIPTAKAKGIQLDDEVRCASGDVDGDRARLYQCVWQLLSNALKFTPRGGHVWLSLRLCEAPHGREIELVVSDNGPGMSKEFAARAFEPFTQQDMSTVREFGGLGLGLAFVRHVLELHGGSIDVVSEGEGAAFRLRLPAAS